MKSLKCFGMRSFAVLLAVVTAGGTLNWPKGDQGVRSGAPWVGDADLQNPPLPQAPPKGARPARAVNAMASAERGRLEKVQQDLRASEYHVTWTDKTGLRNVAATHQAPNRAHGVRTYFTEGGPRLVSRHEPKPTWSVNLGLESFGRGAANTKVIEPRIETNGNRVEYRRPGITEWYVNDARGLEQGFTIETPPRGEGDLVLRLGASEAAPRAVEGGVEFFSASGARVLRYDELHAFAKDGRELPSRITVEDQRIELHVTATEADYPVLIDPMATGPNWTAESDQAGAYFGYSVAAAGDVNRDGYADVIIGAPHFDNGEGDEGRAFVYHGSANGLSVTAAWTAESNQINAQFGYSVASAGDVNGDGYADVIVGAFAYDNGSNDEGRAFVYHGGPTGLSAVAAWTAESDQVQGQFGNSVASAGDVNGDGYADVIVGAHLYDNGQADEGRAYVYHGTGSGLSAVAAWTSQGDQTNGRLGYSVASAGDVNGDGYADVVVSAVGYDNGQTDEGRVYVYHGGGGGLSATVAWTAESDQADAAFGLSVSRAGDVNGDGYDDVIVGAYTYDNGQSNEGRAFVYHGGATGLFTTAAWTSESDQPNAHFGNSVASAGDVNGDGYADVIVGAYAFERAFVYHGGVSGLSSSATWMAHTDDQPNDYIGWSVASAGDVNGDGFADVIAGAYLFDNGQADEGRAYVFHGGANAAAPGTLTNSTLDSAGSVGEMTSLAIGTDGLGLISYRDLTNGDLKVAHCSNTACTAATTTTIDSTGDVGYYTTITIGADGLGLISYHDDTNGDLKVAHCSNLACTAATTATIDSTGVTGVNPSIAIGTDGFGLISYADYTNGDLKVAHCSNTVCSSATTATVDADDSVGWYSSIAIGNDGLGLISYADATNGDLRVAHCSNADCSIITRSAIDSTGVVGAYTSLAIGSDGLGLISYYDATNGAIAFNDSTNGDLKVAHCSNVACTTATTTTLDSVGNVGVFTSIAKGVDGLGLIAYCDGTNLDLKVAHCLNLACTTAATAVLDSSGNVCQFASMKIGADGFGLISHQDRTNFDLKVAHCGDVACGTAGANPSLFQFASSSFVVAESAGALLVTVQRLNNVSGAATVGYATSSLTAQAGSDFSATSGTLSFADGEAVKTFTVQIASDGAAEANETFRVTLSAPTGVATMTSPYAATVTIIDGSTPAPKVSVGDLTLTEGNAGTTSANFTVALSGPTANPVTVKYATSGGTASEGSDFVAAAAELTFPPGTTTRMVTVPVVGDSFVESNETFNLTLSAPANAALATGGVSGGMVWTQLSPTGGPPAARQSAISAYDSANDRLIMFGGYAGGFGPNRALQDLWILSGAGSGGATAWLPLAPSGTGPLGEDGLAVYRASTNRFIVFGTVVPDASATEDPFVLANANGLTGTPTWSALPSLKRAGASVAYDETGNRLIVFGGFEWVSGVPAFRNETWVLVGADGTGTPSWVQLYPTGLPPLPRAGAQGFYDAGSNRLIVYGGGGPGAGSGFEDLWVLINANGLGGAPEWIRLLSTSPVPPRYGEKAVYDPRTKRLTYHAGLAGGNSASLGDTWVLEHADGTTGTPRWIQASPSGSPVAGRAQYEAILAPGTDRMVVTGGQQGATTTWLNDVWVLSNATGQNLGDGAGLGTIVNDDLPSSTSWSQLTPSGGPGARGTHFMAIDTANNRMMTFGGASGSFASGTPPLYNDVWVLTNQDGQGGAPAWSQLSPSGTAPAARGSVAGGYDATNNRLILFGGNRNIGNCNFHSNDAWVLTNANGLSGTPAWIQLSPTGTPPSQRSRHSAAYDAANNRLIVFGGSGSCNEAAALKNDVWILTNANGLGGTPAWTQLSPTGTPPAVRDGASMTYDPASNRLTVFSGSAVVTTPDVWVLSNANGLGGTPVWTQQSPTGTAPSGRSFAVFARDGALDQMFVFSGQTPTGQTNETWVLANASASGGTPAFVQASPSGSPPAARSYAGGVWQSASRRLTVFGGIVGTNTTSDIWVFAEAQAIQNGNLSFSSATYSVSETGPTATITVARTGGSTGAVSVQYTTSNGTAIADDYTAASGTLNWANGDSASKTFTVPVTNDGAPESNETVTLTLSNPTGGATLASPAVATLTILDTSQPSVSIGDVSVTEGNAGAMNANFTVSLSFAPVSADVTLNWAASNGTATTADNDYVGNSGSLTFVMGSGVSTQQVSVTVNGDTNAESDETFLVTLSALTSATFADSQAQGTILNDDFSASQAWQPLRSMTRGHTRHTATLLPNGKLLIAGGDDATGASSELFDPATGLWSPSGNLVSARSGHSATLLPNGKVLVAGGSSLTGQYLQSAELYDPNTGLWTATGSMLHSRIAHTATLLNSGKVLAVGGVEGTNSQRFAEIYDPATGVWTATGTLLNAGGRAYHTATLLPNGQVLIAGGSRVEGVTLTTLLLCDVFDPASGINGAFVPAGTLNTGRAESPTATLLTNGKVLLVGGLTSGVQQTSGELYDPTLNSWAPTGSLTTGRHQHAASLLPNGNVMVVGGLNGVTRLSSAEVYNAGTGAWQSAGALNAGRYAHTASLLPSGKVVVAGGSASTFLTSVEMYDPFTGTWAAQGTIGSDRRRHTATLLPNGSVLLAAGETGGVALATALRFDPSAGTWSATGALATTRTEHTANLLSDGRVIAAGGHSSGNPRSSAELYSSITGLWTPTGSMTEARFQHTATVLSGGRVFVVGGQTGGNNATAGTEVYDKDTAQWTPGPAMNRSRYAHTATLLRNGTLLVAGGHDGNASIGSALLYDPLSASWRATGSLNVDRMNHTATLLPSGKVLVAGGISDQNEVRLSAEVYDPATETWTLVGNLAVGHESHAAALLDDGSVLVAGGALGTGAVVSEVFDGLVGVWRQTGAINAARYGGALTVLASGRILLSGGHASGGTEVFDLGHLDARRPVIQSAGGTLTVGGSYTVTGLKFGGGPEASGGGANTSAANYPILELRSLQDDQVHRLTPGPVSSYATEPLTLNVSNLPSIDPGFYRVTVRRAGVPSVSTVVSAQCTISISSHPSAQTAPLAGTATFSVVAPGALSYQWLRNGQPITGASSPTYTTPPVTIADVGTLYSVRAIGRCGELVSTQALLNVADALAPAVDLLAPRGGEYWTLSSAPPEPARTQIVSWSMSDNIRICRVEVILLASSEGGAFAPVPPGGFLPASDGLGGVCSTPVTTASSIYTVPVNPPSGVAGSLYKIQVRVTDHAGNLTIAETPRPFYMIRPNTDSVKTVIVTNLPRLQARFGSGSDYTNLVLRLNEFASHPKVQGVILDVSQLTDLGVGATSLYKAWDDDPTNPDRANQVLFGCPSISVPGCTSVKVGVQKYVHDLLRDNYTGVEYIVIVGDDGIIPMARLTDRGTLFTESNYSGVPPGPIASALAANKYLSDDPLAVRASTRPDQLAGALFVPEISLGRLVETPAEMSKVIATFISQDGLLDLDLITGPNAHKVMVTGYDFLTDMSKHIRTRWKNALNASTPDNSLTPVDASLIGGNWNLGSVSARETELRSHLGGNGGARYGVTVLGGHASHFEEGVPGTNPFDIQGLDVRDLYGPDTCGTPGQTALDLSGGIVYSVGCHGGLTVPGSCAASTGPSARTLDLPQTYLSRGVVAYVANSGYAWGLKHGVGYGERLMELLTEEMTRGGTVVTGDAVRRTKNRYFLETPRYDGYDEKTLMQWTFYGLPMYSVKSAASASAVQAPLLFSGTAPTAEEKFRTVRQGRVGISAKRLETVGTSAPPPPYLTVAEVNFDFSASGLYRKWNSAGDDVSAGPAGCADPNGCYYTLNNLADRSTGASDLPVQPYFIYDSRLSGTSQHGVLWKGGVYDQENNWKPVFAELQSNGGDASNHGVLPREIMLEPVAPRIVPGGDNEECRPTDVELNSTVVGAGEAVKDDLSSLYSKERRYRSVNLEFFYFNDTRSTQPTFKPNCDRQGPSIGAGPFAGKYHQATGAQVSWSIPVTDIEADGSDVWRVLVVVNDNSVDGLGRGRWTPIELTRTPATTTWTATQAGFAAGARLTYVVQAVDLRGNVSWLEYTTSTPVTPLNGSLGDPRRTLGPNSPASGVEYGIPLPISVQITVAPTVTSPTSTLITLSGATLGGNVTSDGGAAITGRGVVYSLTSANTNPVIGGAGVTAVTASAAVGVFTAAVTGLSPATGYSFKAYATNASGTSYTSASTFTTLGAVPTVTSPTSTLIAGTTATLGGTVTSDGGSAITERGIVYSRTAVNANPVVGGASVTKSVVSGTTGLFSSGITGLLPGSGYSFKAFATNAVGTGYTTVAAFATLQFPSTTTGVATSVTMTSATLNGTVNPNGSSTTALFEYGTTTGYGSQAAAAPAPGSGSSPVGVSASISGLNCGTTYHFRVAASSAAGPSNGSDGTFTTGACGPAINSFTASPVLVNPGGSSTLAWSVGAGATLTLNGAAVSSPTGSQVVNPSATTTYTLVATGGGGSTTRTATVSVNDGTSGLGIPTVTSPANGQVVGVTGVGFTWTGIGGASGYDIRVVESASGGVLFSGSLAGAASTSTLISLPAGSYRFAVRACSGGFAASQCGGYGTVSFTVTPVAPSDAPTVTFPSQGANLTSSTQTLSWTAVAPNPAQGGLTYEVLLRDLTAGTTALQITVPSPTLSTIFTMKSSTQYELKVRACQAGCGPYSTAVTFAVTLPAVPTSTPSGVSCSVSGGNSLTCNWSAVSNADAYQVQVVQAPPAGPGGGALTAAAKQVSATTVTLPVPAGAATVFIAACNGDGCGPNATTAITAAGPNPSQANIGTPMAGTVVAGPAVLFTWNRVPGDNGSNTFYRLFVQDLSRQSTALDVYTTSNFYSAYFKSEGARYDALVISNPGLGTKMEGPSQGFNVAGSSATSPTLVSPPHNSTVSAGNVSLGWSPVPGATLYEYFVAVLGQGSASARGVTPGLIAQAPLTGSGAGTVYSGIVRACPAGATCVSGSDVGWGPWSNAAGGPGVTNFTVVP